MKLTSTLPLAHLFFKHWHTDDTEVGIVVAKARFVLHSDGRFYGASEAPELALADIFKGDPAISALEAEQDIAPHKPATDLTVQGVARAPGGQARADWPVHLSVQSAGGEDLLQWGFHVRGPTTWQRTRTGWLQSEPTPVSEVPLDYALSYGGTLLDESGQPADFYGQNPAGIGFATKEALQGQDTWPAPQIGELAEFMEGGDPTREMAVRGFGPTAKTWLPRRATAGTFDEAWEQTRHPRMPADYDLIFWNAAPTALQRKPYLRGDEVIALQGLDRDPKPVALSLPGVGLVLSLTGETQARVAMELDTVAFDLRTAPILDLVWRVMIPDPASFSQADIGGYTLTSEV